MGDLCDHVYFMDSLDPREKFKFVDKEDTVIVAEINAAKEFHKLVSEDYFLLRLKDGETLGIPS